MATLATDAAVFVDGGGQAGVNCMGQQKAFRALLVLRVGLGKLYLTGLPVHVAQSVKGLVDGVVSIQQDEREEGEQLGVVN